MATEVKNVDPRVKRTRKLLQQAFMELFQEKGFSTISIQDITDRATVNRATFYAHFPDKYALLDSIMRDQFQNVVASQLLTGSKGSRRLAECFPGHRIFLQGLELIGSDF